MIPPDSVGFFRIPKDFSRFVRIPQVPQIPKDPSGSQTPKNIMGSSEIFQDSPHFPERFLRLPRDSLRSLWTPMDSGGFFRVPVDSRSFLKTPQGVSNSPRLCRILSDSSWIFSFLWISLGSSGSFRFLKLPSASTRFLRRFR